MTSTVLVTGAAGFIGSHVVDALVARGDTVVGLDNLNDYYDPARKRSNVAECQANAQASPGSYTFVQGGHVRVNGAKIAQASHEIRPGDVLTVTLERRVVVYKVVDCGTRRGPATEARLLYEDLSPPAPPKPDSALDRIAGAREPGAGRPTKKDRRALDRLHGEDD